MTYQEYLDSPWWKQRRKDYLNTHPTCARCGASEGLNVHHLFYADNHGSVLGGEKDEELATLCRACHQDYHRVMSEAAGRMEPLEQSFKAEIQTLVDKYRPEFVKVVGETVGYYFKGYKTKDFPHIAAAMREKLQPHPYVYVSLADYIRIASRIRKSK